MLDHIERGNADMSSINLKTLWGDVRSILRMRAFWTWFFYGLLAFAPAGIYFTAFLYYMDHVIRSDGLLATVVVEPAPGGFLRPGVVDAV